MKISLVLILLTAMTVDFKLTRANATVDTLNSEQQHDLEITQSIRQELMKDSSLSSRAKKVKIIARYGDLVLAGTVRTDLERNKIAFIAKKYVGENGVLNNLIVKPVGAKI